MTLVGREAWSTFGAVRHGTIIEQHFHPDYCVLLVNGERIVCTSGNFALTEEELLQQCEDNRDYWEHQAIQAIRGGSHE